MTRLERKGIRLIVHLPAEVDHHHTEEIRRQVDAVIQEEPIGEVEFDFRETGFMDSAGIGLIVGRYQMLKGLNGCIRLTNRSRQIDRILQMSGIEQYIPLEKETRS